MKRCFWFAPLLVILACGSGCAMCASNWDYAYAGYGGKWQRGDQFHGRVNSAFDPAGGMVTYGESTSPSPTPSEWVYEGALEPTPDMTGN